MPLVRPPLQQECNGDRQGGQDVSSQLWHEDDATSSKGAGTCSLAFDTGKCLQLYQDSTG